MKLEQGRLETGVFELRPCDLTRYDVDAINGLNPIAQKRYIRQFFNGVECRDLCGNACFNVGLDIVKAMHE